MELEILNPWWKGKEYIEEDKQIKEFRGKKYQWKPKVLQEIPLVPDNVFTLRGPRQVGKTTLMKLLIHELLQKVPEKAVFYWNCDELVDFRELSAVIREYLVFSKVYQIQEKYFFLDEISRVRNWQRSIKSMRDSGELDNCFILMTGSHTLDIKYGMERLPGRMGKQGKDIVLLPLRFSEYVALVEPEIAQKIKKCVILSTPEINKACTAAWLYNEKLQVLFQQYLFTGGFPLVINEWAMQKNIPEYVYELYANWVAGDIAKWGKQEKILIQLLKSVITKQGTPIGWDALAKDAEIKSHKTVSAYVEDLENMFLLLVLYFLDVQKKVPNSTKNKKIYFLDPFLFHVFNKKIYFKEAEILPALIEGTVISNIARLTYDTAFLPQIYYWKNKKEVDAVVKIKDALFPFEIKWQTTITREDFKGLYHFNKGILITKDTFNLGEKYSAIPAHIFLAVV